VVGCSYRGLPAAGGEIRNPIGANMALRRETVLALGGFTTGIGRVGLQPLGCEETELAIRATRATGGRFVIQRSAVIDHFVTADRQRFSYFLQRCWAEGISKALIARTVGSDTALASERSYIARTLSSGVGRGLVDAARGEAAGFLRASAIFMGLAVTAAGYARGRARSDTSRIPGGSALPAGARATRFQPIWVGELEIIAPHVPAIALDASGTPAAQARLLVRAAGTPVGFLTLDLDQGALSAEAAARLAAETFSSQTQRAISESAWTSATPEPQPITVALCTRNRPEGAARTLESLLALRHRQLEIIVVDNGSADSTTRDLVSELASRDARVRYVQEPRQGLSYARNRAIAEAQHEIIAFTDDDVTVDGLWLHGILRGFARRADVACVTGLVVSASLSHPAEQYFDRRVWWSSSCVPRVFTAERLPSDPRMHPYSAGMFGTGANFACKTSVLRSLGGFDQCLGAGSRTGGGEDLDMFVRVISSGYTLCYEPSAITWHHHRVDADALLGQMRAYGSGLTAYLTKYLLDDRTRWALLRRAAAGCLHTLTLTRRVRDSGRAAGLQSRRLASAELRGMLVGPFAYLCERRGKTPDHTTAVRPIAPAPRASRRERRAHQ
jgi:GT2 family glycosyltransferase